MADEMIEALAANGGVIQINFGSSFLDDGYRLAREGQREEIKRHLEQNGIDETSDQAHEYRERFGAEHPLEHASVTTVADHIDHVVGLVGIDHVGLGSDFDGVGDSLPDGLRDVSEYPNLLAELLERGYDEAQIEKICSGNLLRVWAEVERLGPR
jgi:membrane dipeptidase